MKAFNFKTLIALAGLCLLIACKEEESNVEKYYQGAWEIKSKGGSLDTAVIVSVNGSGDFTYDLLYGGGTITVVGEVDQNGKLLGDISTSATMIGATEGTLNQEGLGTGTYQIVDKTFTWNATKQ